MGLVRCHKLKGRGYVGKSIITRVPVYVHVHNDIIGM